MLRLCLLLMSLLVLLFGLGCRTQGPTLSYPETGRGVSVDTYHGVEVADPYRWLEADVRESNRVREWVTAQNEVTFNYLETLPERQRIKARMT